MKILLYIHLLLFSGLRCIAQDITAYQEKYYQVDNFVLPYRWLVPADSSGQRFPLLIFLHGAFEKGYDNKKQLLIGGRFFMRDSVRDRYPAYILFPQCPPDDSWAYFENQIDFSTGYAKDWVFPFRKTPTPVSIVLKKLVDSLLGTGKIDPARVYIAGLSQGGMGVLDLIARYPECFAAGISMCGAGNPATTRFFAGKVPLWLFHGDKDSIVPSLFSKQYFRHLKRAHSEVKFNLYPGIEHDCWNKAFAEPDLMKWLFTRKKS